MDSNDFTFTVTVTGLDVTKWEDDYGLPIGEGRNDFQTLMERQLPVLVQLQLERLGYPDATATASTVEVVSR